MDIHMLSILTNLIRSGRRKRINQIRQKLLVTSYGVLKKLINSQRHYFISTVANVEDLWRFWSKVTDSVTECVTKVCTYNTHKPALTMITSNTENTKITFAIFTEIES